MDVGMLWFDCDKKVDFDVKVKNAATYYYKKYGHNPNLCYVHPSMLTTNGSKTKKSKSTENVEIRSSKSLLPNHFWLGVNQEN